MKQNIQRITNVFFAVTSSADTDRRTPRMKFHPTITLLEDRCVPANLLWIGPNNGLWNTPVGTNNWYNPTNDIRTNSVANGDALFFGSYSPQQNIVYNGFNTNSVNNSAVSISHLNITTNYTATITLNAAVTVTGTVNMTTGQICAPPG